MARPTYTQAKRKQAFDVWRKCDRNVAKTLQVLRDEHDWPLARGTLLSWVRKYEWHKRADGLEQEENRAEAASEGDLNAILADLLARKASYDDYFDYLKEPDENGNPQKPDNAATKTYSDLCLKVIQVQRQLRDDVAENQEDGETPEVQIKDILRDFYFCVDQVDDDTEGE